MQKIRAKLTILFVQPFWIGLYERELDGTYEVCKITFGAEPKDYEVYECMLRNWGKLRFSPAVEAEASVETRVNPKRMQRQIQKQAEQTGIGTKAQQAMKLQQAQGKLARQVRTHAQREAEKQRQFALHQAKQKEKHRGH